MEEKEEFDKRYHASYVSKLKTVPLEKVENTIAKAMGELTHDRVECTIVNFNAERDWSLRLLGANKQFFLQFCLLTSELV